MASKKIFYAFLIMPIFGNSQTVTGVNIVNSPNSSIIVNSPEIHFDTIKDGNLILDSIHGMEKRYWKVKYLLIYKDPNCNLDYANEIVTFLGKRYIPESRFNNVMMMTGMLVNSIEVVRPYENCIRINLGPTNPKQDKYPVKINQ